MSDVRLEVTIAAADFRALWRWLVRRPGAARRNGALTFLLPLAIGAYGAATADGKVVLLGAAGVVLGIAGYAAFGSVNERRLGGRVVVDVDGRGIRWTGRSAIAVAWSALDDVGISDRHLFASRGQAGFVVPLGGADRPTRARIAELAMAGRAAPPAPLSPAGGGAVELRWTSTTATSYAFQRAHQRFAARQLALGSVVAGLLFGALVAVGAERTPLLAGILSGLCFGLLQRVLLVRLTAWSAARRAPHGASTLRIDDEGLTHTNPLTTWQLPWGELAAWGLDDRHLVVLGSQTIGTAVPRDADGDVAAAEARLAASGARRLG